MMITIHGFPAKTKYQDVKLLIKGECNINDFILDNLLIESSGTKKVRIGLTDNSDGYKLMKCLDGYRMPGNCVLKVVPVGRTGSNPPESNFDSRSMYPNHHRNEYPNPPRNDYMSHSPNDYMNKGVHGNLGPHGPVGSHMPGGSGYGPYDSSGSYGHGSQGPRGPHGQPSHQNTMDMGRPSPWASSSTSTSQWTPNQAMATQIPQNSFNFNAQPLNMNPVFGQQLPQNPGHPQPFTQGRAGPDQNTGFPSKNIPPAVPPARSSDSRSALRNIETVDTNSSHAPEHGRYPATQPFTQDKPLIIKKDNFQGPTSYNITNSDHTGEVGGRSPPYQSQSTPSPWQSQAQQSKQPFSKESPTSYGKQYDDRKYIQPDQTDIRNRDPKNPAARPEPAQDRTYKDYEKRRGFSPRRSPHRRRGSPETTISPSGRRVSPSGRRVSPSARRVSPSARRISPSARRVSPSGRRVSPPGRHVSPTARRGSPTGKRVSPPGRRISPPIRRVSPPGRRVSPADRRVPAQHPAARRASPHKRLSPNRRLVSPRNSPGRRDSASRLAARYSPDRADKYGQDKLKQVRPAYEPTAHASNQAKYSGGYRPNYHESVQYPMQGMRQVEQRKSPWQRDTEDVSGSMKNQDDDRRDMSRMQLARGRVSDLVVEPKRNLTPQRKSRSPLRRDRSPYRDHYKRISPSTRSSQSPSRSWALEKRRSPEIRDAPPPPTWPGQNIREDDYPRSGRANFPERDQTIKEKHIPVWERPIDKDEPRGRRPENIERRPFHDDKNRTIKVFTEREPIPHSSHLDRLPQREPKFCPREYADTERRENFRRREDSPDRKPHRDDYESVRRPREHEDRPHPDDHRRRREPSPRHDSRKEDLANPNIDQDFEDIYKKALQFKKKAEELRKMSSKKKDDFLEDEHRSHHSEREREDNSRSQRYEDRPRYSEEEHLRARDREERARDERMREDRSRDGRPRHDVRADDAPRRDYRPRDDYPPPGDRERDRNDERPGRFFTVSPSMRIKRQKAVEEIANKIINRHENYRQVKGEQRIRMMDELERTVTRIVNDMFGDNDVSFIEIVVKYQAKFNIKDEEKMLQDVMASLPIPFRTIKRKAPESLEVLPKTARRSQSPKKPETSTRPKLSDSRWSMNIVPPEVVTMPILGVPPGIPPVMNQAMVPMMVPAPFMHPYESLPQAPMFVPEPMHSVHFQQSFPESSTNDECYKLYLCKDDFNQITDIQADLLKNFVVSQMFKETEVSQGWAPDFTLKGLQSPHRYELLTKDDSSRDWLVNLDFSEFKDFHVLVYTKEELWYERAAVWLPGHSRSRNIEPLDKLKLQNKKVEGINVGKWKFVKKIVTQKGTRLYVDMPPSSARALEKHKMMLSYELQKVNVFLKAVAVDKDAFDAGLKEPSVVDAAEIAAAIQNSPMPSLTYDPSLVKITLKGCKVLSLAQARKIKEVIIYHLFQYLQQDGSSKTDFMKYGFFPPNYFGIVPQNLDSKRWLLSRHLGKVHRQAVVVLGGEEENTRFFQMTVSLPNEYQIKTAIVAERLKQSNQGVKGINFNIWKPIKVVPDRKKARFEVEIDLESLETLSKMKYQLDYVDHTNTLHSVYFKSEFSESILEELIDRCKSEMNDSYDIANMDLDSDQSDDDIICLD